MVKKEFPDAFSQWWKEAPSYFYSEVNNVGTSAAVGFTSAIFLVISYLMLICSRAKFRAAAACGMYSLIGDLCHLTGAFLSNQTHLQRIMASIMVMLDGVYFISVTLPLYWWNHSTAELFSGVEVRAQCRTFKSFLSTIDKSMSSWRSVFAQSWNSISMLQQCEDVIVNGRRVRMLSRRRGQNFLVVGLLFGMGGCVYADVCVRHMLTVTSGTSTSRKLLNVIIHDQTELLGYVLGLLSFAISWTFRIPFFLKANRGELSNSTHISSRGFSALAGALYASAILLYDPRLESVVKALPWILSGACCAVLDILILILSCYRICYKWQSAGTLHSDTESLLGRFPNSSRRVPTGLYHTPKDQNDRERILSWKSSSSKMPERGSCKNTNVQPVRKVCLKEVTITQEDVAENQPLKGSVKVVRVDECYSSGSATDSSCFSSELEWDFEETPPQWCSQNGDGQKMDAFPLQEWAGDQRSKSNMSTSSSTCFCNSAVLDKRRFSGSPDTNQQSCSDSVK